MYLSNLDKLKLQKYIKTIEADDQIIALILHGSACNSEKYHDVDIALIPKDASISEKCKLDYSLQSPDNFDVRFLQDFPIYIAKDVIKGKILLNKNYELVFDTYIAIIQEWEMFRPSFELYMDVILNGL